MKWGDQIDVPVSRNKWRIKAELSNGTVVESSGAVTDNPYLVIEDRGHSNLVPGVRESRRVR